MSKEEVGGIPRQMSSTPSAGAEGAGRDAEPSAGWRRKQGPVEALCREIGFPFDYRLERPDVFVAFVRELVGEIADQRDMAERIAHLTNKPPSEGSAEVLALAVAMLAEPTEERAAAVHDAADVLNLEDRVPTDHTIDMLVSCASAIRFGLVDKFGLESRHAAEAANHVWKQVYGVSRFDSATPAWEKDWARQKLTSALISLLPASGASHPQPNDTPADQAAAQPLARPREAINPKDSPHA